MYVVYVHACADRPTLSGGTFIHSDPFVEIVEDKIAERVPKKKAKDEVPQTAKSVSRGTVGVVGAVDKLQKPLPCFIVLFTQCMNLQKGPLRVRLKGNCSVVQLEYS